MSIRFVSQPIDELLKELSLNAEREIQERLKQHAVASIERIASKITEEVLAEFRVAVNATVMRALTDDKWEVRYSITQKKESK